MGHTPGLQEISELMRGELWASIRPLQVRGSCAAKIVLHGGRSLCCSGILAHFNDVRPISLAVNYDEELLAAV